MEIKEVLTLRWSKYRFYKNMSLFYILCVVVCAVTKEIFGVAASLLGLFSMLTIWHLEIKQKREVHKLWATVLHELAEKHKVPTALPPPETGEYATGVHPDLCNDDLHNA